MRERLIELMRQAEFAYLDFSKMHPCEKSLTDFTADYLLENGVIVPPCKVGTTIYMIVTKRAKVTREYFHFIKKTKLTFLNLERVLENWGKTVFLTREETEKALKGGAKMDGGKAE